MVTETKPRASRANPFADPDALLRLETVSEVTTLGRTTIYRMMDQGDFPESVPISRNRVGWRAGDVLSWLRARGIKVAQ
jgi:prophage regulatory protein